MTPRVAAGEPTPFSRALAETIDRQIGISGFPVAHILKEAGISRNYYYKRIRGESVFNLNDIDNISRALDLDPFSLTALALAQINQNSDVAGEQHNRVTDIHHFKSEKEEREWIEEKRAVANTDPDDNLEEERD